MTKRNEDEADDYDSFSEPEADACSSHETIGLFGAHGDTGKHFVKLALDAGYAI